jgi:superfamily II DNA/RNA helicase
MVGTPGRVEDLMARGSLRLNGVRMAVLDEADRMLDVGFLPAIERILRATPAGRQTALFSATMPTEVRGLAQRQMRDPLTVAVDPEKQTVDEIEQRFQQVIDGDKLSALRAYLDDPSCFLALVFRRTTHKVDRLTRDLTRAGYKAAALHGRRTQSQRERVLGDLRSCKLQVLVATDIAARGLDISGLTHVFNFDLPDTPETYVHRIGRTGRAGETGTAVTFVGPEDAEGLRELQRFLAGRSSEGQGRMAASSGRRPQAQGNKQRGGGQRNASPRPNAPRSHGQRPTGPRSDGPRPNGQQPNGPRSNGSRPNGQRPTGPRSNGQQSGGQEANRAGNDRSGQDRRRGKPSRQVA